MTAIPPQAAAPTGLEFGARPLADGRVCFRVWAPAQPVLSLDLEGTLLQMSPLEGGWHELVTAQARVGSRYRFRLSDGRAVPDPASRFQPDDVHGPSEVVDPDAYPWQATGWRGRPWHETVIYELHVGSFTPEGTFRAAIGRLDHLVRLGVTAIELMPIADFPGRWNWGYDGVLPFAPDSTYGRPEDLQALVDAAHIRGLMVFLDVVYNHFGPEGNYLSAISPGFFTGRHSTPWGDAVNFDDAGSGAVREFFQQNALYWLEKFRLDGLRLDAVHAIRDDSTPPFLADLAARVRERIQDRPVHLILENEENQGSWLEGPQGFTAQWNDDLHHALHLALTGETEGYYADYADWWPDALARTLAEGFAFQGQHMPCRGSPRGEASAHLPPWRFVSFLQNHDQIGNRARGDRLANGPALEAATALLLLAPQVPLLFMGQEWGTPCPFPFFCDFAEPLASAVRQGRRREFSRFAAFQDPEGQALIPDPTAEATFASARLDWDSLDRAEPRDRLTLTARLLAVRRREIVPLLPDIGGWAGAARRVGAAGVAARWAAAGVTLHLEVNLADHPQAGFGPAQGTLIWRQGEADEAGHFGPWSLRCWRANGAG